MDEGHVSSPPTTAVFVFIDPASLLVPFLQEILFVHCLLRRPARSCALAAYHCAHAHISQRPSKCLCNFLVTKLIGMKSVGCKIIARARRARKVHAPNVF